MYCEKCKTKMICANSREVRNRRYRLYKCPACGAKLCTTETESDLFDTRKMITSIADAQKHGIRE